MWEGTFSGLASILDRIKKRKRAKQNHSLLSPSWQPAQCGQGPPAPAATPPSPCPDGDPLEFWAKRTPSFLNLLWPVLDHNRKSNQDVAIHQFTGPLHWCSHSRTKASSHSLTLAGSQLPGALTWTLLSRSGTYAVMTHLVNIQGGTCFPHIIRQWRELHCTSCPRVPVATRTFPLTASTGTTGLCSISSPGMRECTLMSLFL